MRAPADTFEGATLQAMARMDDASRTRKSMAVSVVAHVLLMACIVLYRPPAHIESNPIEIAMLDPGEGADAAPAAAAPAMAGSPSSGAPRPAPTEQRFQREMVRGDVVPVPMADAAFDDAIASRLANLRSTGPSTPGRIADAAPVGSWGAPANVPSGLGGGGTGTAPSIAPSRIGTPSKASEPSAPGRADASRNLAGARLLGPVADRPIVHVVTPAYPEWAKKEGVEGAVTLHFIVRADGTVKENVLVQRTAGFEDFDENARVALRAWRFEPLHGGRTGEQWGTITFHYRLRDAG